jgi:hypothetical protein
MAGYSSEPFLRDTIMRISSNQEQDLISTGDANTPAAGDNVGWAKASALLVAPWLIFTAFCVLSTRQFAAPSLFVLFFSVAALSIWMLCGRRPQELYLLAFLATLSVLRIGYVTGVPIPLSGDEALFWDCSRRLDWCFVTKGPGAPLCIWCTRMLLGNTELGVRGAAIVLSFAASLVLYLLGRRLYGRKVGILSAVLLQIVPIYAFHGVAMTTDPPLIFLWLLSLLLLHRAWTGGRGLDWMLLGLAAGLGILTKYTMAVFFLPTLFFVLLSSRRLLMSVWPYIALLVCLAVISPLVIWNAQHQWVNILHNIGETHIANGVQVSLRDFGEFFGSQLGVVTPLLLPMIIWASIKLRRQEPLCFWFTVVPLGLFVLKSLQGPVLANWALCSYLAALVSFSMYFLARRRLLSIRLRRLADAAVIVAAAMTIMLYIVPVLPLPRGLDPFKRVRSGAVQLGHEVARLSQQLKPQRFIFSNNYMTASLLGFYVDGQPYTYCVDLGRRVNEFDVWPTFHCLVHYDAILVLKGDVEMPKPLQDRFKSYRKQLLEVLSSLGGEKKTYSVFLCRDFQGMVRVMPTRYN